MNSGEILRTLVALRSVTLTFYTLHCSLVSLSWWCSGGCRWASAGCYFSLQALIKPVCTVGQKWIFDSVRAPNSKRTFACLTLPTDNMKMKIWTVSPAAPIVCWGLPSCWRKQQSPLELVTWFEGESLCRLAVLTTCPQKSSFRFPARIKGGRANKLPLHSYLIGRWEFELVWCFVLENKETSCLINGPTVSGQRVAVPLNFLCSHKYFIEPWAIEKVSLPDQRTLSSLKSTATQTFGVNRIKKKDQSRRLHPGDSS